MAIKKGRKVSGGRYIQFRKKKLNERSGQKRIVKLGETKRKVKKTKGGNKKVVLFGSNVINVKKDKKIIKTKITNVLETPSNRFLARQNIITKGTIVETELGKVRVTNRPSQEGVINGILAE